MSPTVTDNALDFLGSLAPLAKVDHIGIKRFGVERPEWLVTAALWRRVVLNRPPGAVAFESPDLAVALSGLAAAVKGSGMDRVQRRPHPDYETDLEVWAETRRRNPSLGPLLEPYLGPVADPVWEPGDAVLTTQAISSFGGDVLLTRHRYGNLDEPDQLWVASDATGAGVFGPSPVHAFMNLATNVPAFADSQRPDSRA